MSRHAAQMEWLVWVMDQSMNIFPFIRLVPQVHVFSQPMYASAEHPTDTQNSPARPGASLVSTGKDSPKKVPRRWQGLLKGLALSALCRMVAGWGRSQWGPRKPKSHAKTASIVSPEESWCCHWRQSPFLFWYGQVRNCRLSAQQGATLALLLITPSPFIAQQIITLPPGTGI
jgi:hypothetical protein